MTVRVEVVTPCEHDLDGVHDTDACWAHEGRHKEQPDCYCQGNNRRTFTEWPPEAIEAAAKAIEAEAKKWPVEDHPLGWGQRVPPTGWYGATMKELAAVALAAALGRITGDK